MRYFLVFISSFFLSSLFAVGGFKTYLLPGNEVFVTKVDISGKSLGQKEIRFFVKKTGIETFYLFPLFEKNIFKRDDERRRKEQELQKLNYLQLKRYYIQFVDNDYYQSLIENKLGDERYELRILTDKANIGKCLFSNMGNSLLSIFGTTSMGFTIGAGVTTILAAFSLIATTPTGIIITAIAAGAGLILGTTVVAYNVVKDLSDPESETCPRFIKATLSLISIHERQKYLDTIEEL